VKACVVAGSVCFLLFSAWLAAAAAASVQDAAHGHALADAELEPLTITIFGERVLLFVEHPPLVRGVPARFLAHFSVLATGAPVRSGRLTLECGPTRLSVDAPKRDGLFTPEGAPTEAGRFAARIHLTSEQVEETLDLGEMLVYATLEEAQAAAHAAAHAAAGAAAQEPAGAVPFLLEQQWKVGLLLSRAEARPLTRRLVVPAAVVLAEGAAASVSVPIAGRLLPPPGGALPRSGERVEAGQWLAVVEPPLSPADAAQLYALDLEWGLEALEIEQALSAALAQLAFAEQESARVAQLLPDGLATRQQADAARRDLALARVARDAALAGKEALERLSSRRAQGGGHVGAGSGPGDAGNAGAAAGDSAGLLRIPLRAPIAGEVVGSRRVQGEALAAGDEVLRIVDGAQLWIEGRVSEFDLQRLGARPSGVASFPALPGLRLEVGALAGGSGLHFAPELDEVSRTLLVRGALPAHAAQPAADTPAGSDALAQLRPGLLADLELALETVAAEVVIPHTAVVLDQGAPTAYVMLEGELFQRRDLTLGLRDGGFVEVLAGVQAGERVATRGADTIRLAALSPASFGAGHQH